MQINKLSASSRANQAGVKWYDPRIVLKIHFVLEAPVEVVFATCEPVLAVLIAWELALAILGAAWLIAFETIGYTVHVCNPKLTSSKARQKRVGGVHNRSAAENCLQKKLSSLKGMAKKGTRYLRVKLP